MTQTNGIVLVVDDDVELLELVSMTLKQIGLGYHGVESIGEAKKWLQADTPCLVILDVMMPGGNGLDLCRWIREQERFQLLPIIISSALKDDDTVQDAMELGAVDFLRKPYGIQTLQEKITRCLKRK